jgi:nucleoside-diphosphate-sugar epimerase
VAEAARDTGARLVHVSSLAAAGPASRLAPCRETDSPRPLTPYGFSKLESERIVDAMTGLRSIILRPGVVYGPTDRAVFPLFQAAQRGVLPLVGRADAAYAFIHVDDVVRTIAAAVEKPTVSGPVFVAHEMPVTPKDLIDAIQAAVGRRGRVIRVPMALTHALALAGDVAHHWVVDGPATTADIPVAEALAATSDPFDAAKMLVLSPLEGFAAIEVDPMAKVPGTLMPIQIADDKTRADVIAYLATLKKEE